MAHGVLWLGDDHRRAHRASGLHVLLRLCGLRERIALADVYPDGAATNQAEQLARSAAACLRCIQVVPRSRARQKQRAATHELEWCDRLDRSGGIAEGGHHAARPQAVEAGAEGVAAYAIVD